MSGEIITPRDYQFSAYRQLGRSLRKHKRTICCMPTGSGKTVLFAYIARQALNKGSSVCILVHRIELVHQTFKMLTNFGIGNVNLIIAGSPPRFGQINIGMVESFHRRFKDRIKSLDLDLLIVDECHIGNFRKVIEEAHCHVIGVTATPVASGSLPLNTYFDDIVCPVTIGHLIEQGFLAKAKTYSVEHDFSSLTKRAGEFTESSQMKEFTKPVLYDGMLENYSKYGHGKKSMCFGVNVQHSQEQNDRLIAAGYSSEHVNGKTPKSDRDEIIGRYKRKRSGILCNVGIATTGFDDPQTRCIIQDHATMSLAKHLQVLGRGSRIYSSDNIFFPDKAEFVVIDMGKNYLRHGLYGDYIDWESIFHDPKKASTATESKKLHECRNCGAIIKITRPKCPYCGDVRSAKEINEQIENQILSVKEIRDYKYKNLPPHLRTKTFGQMSKYELEDYARIMGYNKKWVWVQVNLQKKQKGKRKW